MALARALQLKHIHKVRIHALLTMLVEVPPQLIDLNAQEYLEFSQCRAVLATKLPAWTLSRRASNENLICHFYHLRNRSCAYSTADPAAGSRSKPHRHCDIASTIDASAAG
jgi:hypothetical protein